MTYFKYLLPFMNSLVSRSKSVAKALPIQSANTFSEAEKMDIQRGPPSLFNPVSQACTQSQFGEFPYDFWVERFKEIKRYHRKQWEFVYILQALATHGMLAPGREGLGFGVGKEPLAAVMASYGVKITASDLNTDKAAAQGWVDSSQHASSLSALNDRGICAPAVFSQLVDFRFVDMNAIPEELAGFDFCWSSCAFEHLGSIELGLRFVENSLRCLRRGGVAVHTTEFNCSSDEDTLTEGGTVLFRKRDILALAKRLSSRGYRIVLNLNTGDQPLDQHVDLPPYSSDPHLKLQLGKYTSTSIGLIIEK